MSAWDESINWEHVNCNTCSRGFMRRPHSQVDYKCPVAKVCDRKFSQWSPDRKFKGE